MTFETAVWSSGPLEENGIRLTLLSGHYDIWQCGQPFNNFLPPCTGRVAGIDETMSGPSSVRIELSNGVLFNLMGIEILSADSRAFSGKV